MIANYGYKDGSGEYYLRIDTDKCNGCGDCVKVCPTGVFEIIGEDPNDPLREGPVAVVREKGRTKLKYTCAVCKPVANRQPLPCVEACQVKAVAHSW